MATTAAATTATPALSLKLLIDVKAQRVLFAEASKDVVDFLFSFLALHVGSVVKLLGEEAMVGSVGNLYASVEKLDAAYVQPGVAKDALLTPTVTSPAVSATSSSLFRLPAPPPAPAPAPARPKKFFRCNTGSGYYDDYDYTHRNRIMSCRKYMTDICGTACPSCGGQMNIEVEIVSPAEPAPAPVDEAATRAMNGFVRDVMTYTLMDDLTVAPMSTISSISLLNTFAVKDIGDLQEKTMQLGYNEGLAILKASLQSKTVLTDVFLAK